MAGEEEKSVEEKAQEAPQGIIMRSKACEESRPEEKGCFGFKGGVLAFVDFDGTLYITPGTRMKMELLEEGGLSRSSPQIEVPYSDGSAKSRRWLRINLPKNEVKRSLAENATPLPEGKILAAVKKINRDGLKDLDPMFIEERCARVKGKKIEWIGLAASFRGILSFTDWEAKTYVTPLSDEKLEILKKSGYAYIESMIKVPYALASEDNRDWLAQNIPAQEWEKTEKEAEQDRVRRAVEKVKEKIKELGLKEVPGELRECSAACEEILTENIGMAGAHNGILSYTDGEGVTWVTPATMEKAELLKTLGYQFMGGSIRVPHSLKTQEDIEWLQDKIAEEHWNNARQANLKDRERLEKDQADKRKRKLGIEDLPAEFMNRAIKTEKKQMSACGQYFVRNEVLGFADAEGWVYITPVLKSKIETLEKAKYKAAPIGFPVPHSDGTEEDRDFIRINLSQAELDMTVEEHESTGDKKRKDEIERILSKLDLKELPQDLLKRSAETQFSEISMIGKYQSRSGVTAFVRKDGFFWVTTTVPWKEQALNKAGYRPPEGLTKIPYASQAEEDQAWLEYNLPGDDIAESRRELAELESRKDDEELVKLAEQRGIPNTVPEELALRSAKTGEEDREQLGRYLIQDEFLGFIGPDAHIWITPNAPSKVEILKKANYEYVSRKINLPHAAYTEADRTWLSLNLPEGEEDKCREEIEGLKGKELDDKAATLARQRELKDLPPEFIERCAAVRTNDPDALGMVGRYLERDDLIYLVAPDRNLYITPKAPSKLEAIKKAGYQFPEKMYPLPKASGSEEDLDWIMANLPQGELQRSTKEYEEIEKGKSEEKIKKNMEKHGLSEVPEFVMERSRDSGVTDTKDIGRIGVFRGVLGFVMPDERVFVSWFTSEKQDALEDAGYKLEGYMPIRVPHATDDQEARQWLLDYLPEPLAQDEDDEEQMSKDENAE